MKIHFVAAIAAMIIIQIPASTACAVEIPDDKFDALIKRIDELEHKVEALERSNAAAQPRATTNEINIAPSAPPGKSEPLVSLGARGLQVRTADSNFVFDLWGFMQTDARFYFGNKTVPDTFLLRRIRPNFQGTVYNMFDYRLQLDFASDVNSPGTNNDGFVTEAYVNARIMTNLQVEVGKFKPPVGLEREQFTGNLQFVETGLPTQFTPNYDLGAQIHNGIGLFDHPINYGIGIYNGVADGGSDDIESSDEGKELVGRLFLQPFLLTDNEPLRRLGFGAGGSYGYRSGATRNYTTQGQQTFFSYGNAVSSVTYSGDQYRIDPQAYYYWGPLGIYGECAMESASLRDVAGPAVRTGRFYNTAWQVIGSLVLTGEKNSFNAIVPQNPLGIHYGGWGAVELVGRIGQMSMDQNLFPLYASTTSAQEQTSWGAGVNWHLNRSVKIQLDYESTTFHHGSSLPGSATGNPEHVILSRLQLTF